MSNTATTPFAEQQAVSLMLRLILCGYRTYSLTHQLRCDPTICELINLQYNVLATDLSVSARPSVRSARAWFAKTFFAEKNTVFINVFDGKVTEYSGRSKVNRLNVAVGIY